MYMKNQSIITVLIILIALSVFAFFTLNKKLTPKPIDPTPKTPVFGTSVTIKKQQTITYPDGLALTLKEVNDSRCPANVMCIWAGMLILKLNATGGGFGSQNVEIELTGPDRTPHYVSAKGYTFSIVDDNGETFTILVTKDSDKSACYVGGCSAQICSDQKDTMSSCEFKPEYACYQRTSTCERQTSGACGWTQTQALKACLVNPPQ